VATQKSSRRSRKRRSSGTAPRGVPSQRRERRAEREVVAERQERRSRSTLGTYGERPPSPFGGLPVSEIAIFAGAVGLIIGFIRSSAAPLIVGSAVCTLGVVEFTAREHFSGYRSHAALLAALPAVGIEIGLVVAFGQPRNRSLLLLAVVPVYGVVFWFLRKRFRAARQARVARPPRA
jgi:hypothetical protein